MNTANNGNPEGYIGLLSFLSFGLSVIAAVLAIDMYALLRTGQFGKTWRVLIISSVMLALMQMLRMAELMNFHALEGYHLSEIVELMFVMSLAYAFYSQRSVFSREIKEKGRFNRRREDVSEDVLDDEADKESDNTPHEWQRITGSYDGPIEGIDRPAPTETAKTADPAALRRDAP